MICQTVAETIGEMIDNKFAELIEENKIIKDDMQIYKDEVSEKLLGYEQKLDNMEQYSQRKNIRVFGIHENEKEDTFKVFTDFSKNILKVNLVEDDITRCRRVGEMPKTKQRPILIKFKTPKKRLNVLKEKKKLRGTKIAICEDLTKKRVQKLMDAENKYGIKHTYLCCISNGVKMYEGNMKDKPLEARNN
ncbi:unnamed protein product [Phaedon cochleariae]|uniref:Endonuclease-reverse transcriptase n=1 Tax=Phaedon cochleariae TaxID=80249 RepID=A0A9N9S9Y4_PHACE|nr:unnamed protein product [Phaedon cochleariae]